MKKTLLLMFLVAGTFPGLMAQDKNATTVHHEFGITFSSLNSFGLKYKVGTDKNLLRITALSLDMNNQKTWGRATDSVDIKNSVYGAGLRVGWEHHINLAPSFGMYLGADLGIAYHYTKQNYSNSPDAWLTTWQIDPTLNFVLGACYTLNNRVVFSAEILPGVGYAHGVQTFTYPNQDDQELTMNALNATLNLSSANLTIAYRFGK